SLLFILCLLCPPRSTLFPYTTLFRSTNILVYTCALLQRGMTIISIVSLVVDSIIIVLLVGMTGGANSIYNILFLFLLIRIMYFRDRKSTRLNSSHVKISYAVFCLKKK